MELAEGLTDNSVDETINITNETLDKTDNKTETKTENQNIDGKKQRNEDQASVNSKMVNIRLVFKLYSTSLFDPVTFPINVSGECLLCFNTTFDITIFEFTLA
jgi:hypothetical protein